MTEQTQALNFDADFRPKAEALLMEDILANASNPLELSGLVSALATRTEDNAEDFAFSLVIAILEGELKYEYAQTESVSDNINWWKYELWFYTNQKVVLKVASDHLARIVLILSEQGVRITDTAGMGLFPDD